MRRWYGAMVHVAAILLIIAGLALFALAVSTPAQAEPVTIPMPTGCYPYPPGPDGKNYNCGLG